jgi:hypothetical protein
MFLDFSFLLAVESGHVAMDYSCRPCSMADSRFSIFGNALANYRSKKLTKFSRVSFSPATVVLWDFDGLPAHILSNSLCVYDCPYDLFIEHIR